MNISIFITTGEDIHDEPTCGKGCAFLNEMDSCCILFNEDLVFIQLPEGYEWQDEYSKSVGRLDKCLMFDIEPESDEYFYNLMEKEV